MFLFLPSSFYLKNVSIRKILGVYVLRNLEYLLFPIYLE